MGDLTPRQEELLREVTAAVDELSGLLESDRQPLAAAVLRAIPEMDHVELVALSVLALTMVDSLNRIGDVDLAREQGVQWTQQAYESAMDSNPLTRAVFDEASIRHEQLNGNS